MAKLPDGISRIEEMHFIEDIALFFERIGMPRMAGRILGVLLVSNPPAQSITEIGEKLNASKSSVSIMARLLVENGLIERVPSPEPRPEYSRRDYYRFKEGGWVLYMRDWLALMAELHKITERGLALIDAQDESMKERLEEAHDLFSMIEERFPALLQELEQEREKRTGGQAKG